MFRFLFAGLCLLLLSVSLPARAADGLKLHIFGNSLVHHLSDSDETTVPHWLAFFARASGKAFAADGQWGFLRNFVNDGPKPQWSFGEVEPAWRPQHLSFQEVGHDAIMINPANFIQYQGPVEPYDGENPTGASPVSATLAVIDKTQPKRLVIYEGWADMASFTRSFPPSDRNMRRYIRHNAEDYHAWYETYLKAVQAARPDTQIELLPVARVLSVLLNDGVLADLSAKDLFIDKSPHGTATLYFLAGAISYVGLFQSPLPETVDIPDTVHPSVRSRFAEVAKVVQDELGIPEKTGASGISGFGLQNPSLAMGLDGIADWSPQHPFVDRMKTARNWVGHLPGRWGGWTSEDLINGGYLDEHGWIWGIPPDLDSVETYILTDQAKQSLGLKGRYRVTFDGRGDLAVTGRGRVVKRSEGEIWFTYTPGDGSVGLKIRQTDPDRTGDYIRNITVVHEKHIPLYQVGALFNPDWIAHVQDLRLVRFMDWMETNGSDIVSWDQRPLVTDFSYDWRGVPAEVMLALANEIGVDMWVNVPHQANDDYVRQLAETLHGGLDPGLKVFSEYSNEMWNFGFPQSHWAAEQGKARWGEDVWMQYAGLRAAEVANIWADVFADDPFRLRRVLGVHTGWKGLEQDLLFPPLVKKEGMPAPALSFDAYAVTGYFGIDLGTDEGAPRTLGWIEKAKERASSDGQAKGLKRVRLDQYVAENYAKYAIKPAIQVLRDDSLKHLLEDLLPYHAKMAKQHGLQLIMYEGGSHVVGVGAPTNDDTLTDFFVRLNYSAEMGTLYQELLVGWRKAGGTLFNAFVDVGRPSKWGSWGTLRYLEDENPRHLALTKFNTDSPAWWETRDPDSFLHGRIFHGTDQSDQMQGTRKRDIVLAGAGDDVIFAEGPGDRVHGGAGRDLVVLPGAREAYHFSQRGRVVVAEGFGQKISLFSIETVSFGNSAENPVAVADVF